jgi:hypothetical protein
VNDLRIKLIFLAVLGTPLVAQQVPAPGPTPSPTPNLAASPSPTPTEEPEAPEALFSEKIGDVGVELDAEGTWTTHLAAGFGEGITPQGTLPGLGYPGFAKQPEFQQIPDFSLTLWLFKRYFLLVNYRTTTDDRSFQLGYQGQPGEFVQWVKFGNAPISVPERAGEQLPEGRPGAPAAGAAFSMGDVQTEFLARYEDGSRETHTYRGYTDVTQTTIGIDAWIRGRFFKLPATGPYSGIRVLVEDPSGVFGGFRDAEAGEVVIDSTTGEIRLPASATKRYLVTWSTAPGGPIPNPPPANPSGTPILHIVAQEFTASNLPAGNHWYVLTQPGTSTAFELRNRYPVAAGVTGQILLYNNDTGLVVAGWPVSQSPSNDWFEVKGTPEAPFYSANGYAFEGIYPTQSQGAPPPSSKVLGWAFRLPTTGTATSYALGSDVIPSSIIVERNGVPTSAWKFDPNSGQLTFDTPVFDTDTIVISLQRRKTGNSASDLVLWHGGRWDISDSQNLEWNIESRWNLSTNQTTNEDLESPGRIAGTVAWTGSGGEWNWSLTGTAGALKSDSTGHRILYGQDDSGTQAYIDGDALRPAAAPGDTLSSFSVLSLDETNRAAAIFRNYWTTDPVTGEAVAGQFGKPGVNDEATTSGGSTGPYIVLGDGTRSDRMAVLEATVTPSRKWAGMQVFTDKGISDDLRSTSAITVNIRIPNGSGLGAIDKLYLQAGHLSTDFDGTHAVRAVTYRSTPVLSFLNQKDGFTQYFPIPEGSVWGNDPTKAGSTVPDGDLISLDLQGVQAVTPLLTNATGWQTVRLILTDAQRQKLQGTNGWRLVLTGSSGVQQTVLVGPVIFEGSTWSVVADNSATGTVTPTELDAGDSRNLQVDWSGRPSWSVQGRQNPVRPLSYGTIAFSYQMNNRSLPSTMTVKLSDYKGHGLTATWTVPAADISLHRARISIRGKELTVDGAKVGSVTLSSGALTTSWDRMTISQSGATDGTLTVSSIEAVDPLWEPIGNTLATATWTQGAAWPSADFPIVSDMTLGMTSRQEGVTAETASWIGQTTWNGAVGPIRSSGLASYTTTPVGTQAHGEYEATLPLAVAGGPSVALTDQFSDEGLRAERVVVAIPIFGSLDTMAKVSGPPVTLDQDYRAAWSGLWSDWAASLSAEWTQSRPFSGSTGNFGHQWMTSWGWLVPDADIAPYYLLQSQGTLKTPFVWGPLEALVRSQVAQSVGPVTTWSPSASWQLRNAIRLGDSWTVTPSVTRQVSAVFDRSAVAPQDSASEAAAWIGSQRDGLFGLPFGETGNTDPWSHTPSGLDSGSLQSAGRLDWDRTARQDWTDLALPHSGGFEYTTTRGIDGPAEYRIYEAGAHVEAQGLNLFGSLGAQPVFTWYRTDVWTWSAAGTWQTGTRVQDRISQASAATRAELVLTEEESLALPASYQGTWGASPAQTWTLQPTWSLKRPADLPFDLPRWLSPRSFHRLWVQEISTAMTFGWSPDGTPPLRDLHISWKGRFLLSDKSELDFTTQWGQQWQNNLTVFGLEAAVDFVLSF